MDGTFEDFFRERFSHYLGLAFAAWIEALQQGAMTLALNDWNTTHNNEGDENVSDGKTNDAQQ